MIGRGFIKGDCRDAGDILYFLNWMLLHRYIYFEISENWTLKIYALFCIFVIFPLNF